MRKSISLLSLTLTLILLFTGCASTYYYSESTVNAKRTRCVTSINSYGNYNLHGKTFYIESEDNKVSSNDVEFKEYANYIAKSLRVDGAIETNNKKNADMCILVTYGITDESYVEAVPFPIWGQTGISSISTMSNTVGTEYGSARKIGNSVYGSAQGNSSTNTTTRVNPSYGITGYSSVDRRVTQFRRVLNIYAYDNTQIDKPTMLWKTNMISDGYSSELRNVIPIMAFCAIGYMGNSSGETKNYYVYEDQENYLSWKEGALPDSNIISYPKFNSSNANPNNILIAKINRTSSETVIDFIAYNSGYEWLRISPNTYIEFEKQKYKVRTADNIVLGEKNDINKYNAWKFRLHFPAIPSNANYINISEEESSGWKWNGVSVKK
jgi:hypothetical protein